MSIYLGMLAHPTDGSDGIKEGIHLRWASHYKFGFPANGYRLYRKRSQKKNYHCYSVKQLENINSKGRRKTKYFLDIKLPEESSHVIIKYSNPKTDFKVLAFNNEDVHWKKSVKSGIQKVGKIDIISGKINRIAIIAKYVKIIAICYWTCAGEGWELINDECGFGLPFDAQIDDKLQKKLVTLSKDPCDPYWGMAICRLGKMDCNFKGQNFQDLKDMISEMAGEGIDIPIGWNEFNVEEDGLSCEEEAPPEFGISAYDVLLTQSVNPKIAMMLGLYWVDKKVEDGIRYDYKVEAEWAEETLFKLEHEFTFDEEETAKSYFPLFHQIIKKDNALFQGIKPRILNVSSNFANVERGLAFNYPNNSIIRIIFDKPVKEVQIFIRQVGLKTRLRAYGVWLGLPIKDSILNQKEGILSVHSDKIKYITLEGKGIVILRLHYDFEELPRGKHSFSICGIKKLHQEKLAVPTGLAATCLRGAVTELDDDCNETEYKFRAGLRWDYVGNLNTGLLTKGPIGYFSNRLDPRGNNEILNEGDPIFVIPEDFGEDVNENEVQPLSDCNGNVIEERPYYNDAVLEKGTYKYRVQSLDIFGRISDFSNEVSIDLMPPLPPPPVNVRAKFLDFDSYDPQEEIFKDPTLLIEEKQWLLANKKNGFLIKWSWPDNLQKQAPDAIGFKIHFFAGWLNVYQSIVKEVVTDNEIETTLTFDPDNPPSENALINEWIKVRSFTYKISGNTAGDNPTLTLDDIPEGMVLPEDIEDIQLKTGAPFTLSVSKAIQEGGAAINYNDPANWGDPFHEELIEVPSNSEYSLFIPVPNRLDFPDYSNEKTVYGQIAINTYSEDSEGSMSTPSTVMGVNRQSPVAPVINYPDGETLKASKADYYGKSTIELSWPEDNSLRYNVYRCMDRSLFMIDKRNRATRDPALYTQVIEKLDPIIIEEANFTDPNLDYISLIKEGKYNLLRATASLSDNQEAFGKLNDKPLKGVHTYLDESLDGRGNNYYFYRIRPIDEIGNQGEFSLATPPVEIPKVTTPTAPVITNISGGQKQITIKWSGNPGAGIVGYLVYRIDDLEKVQKAMRLRGKKIESVMGEPLKKNSADVYSVAVTDVLPENNQYEYVDETVEAKVKYYYSVIAIGIGHNDQPLESKMSVEEMSYAYDDSVPEPPEWIEAKWILVDEEGNIVRWPDDGVIPANYIPVIYLEWKCDIQGAEFTILMQPRGQQTWLSLYLPVISTDFNKFIMITEELSPDCNYRFRIKITTPTGISNSLYKEVMLPLPVFESGGI